MNSEWREISLAEFADLNPSRTIKKGADASFIDMAALATHSRDIDKSRVTTRIFSGSGSKFKDGDTLLARITPCLENGKTALVSGLGEGVLAHGSTEFIVMAPKVSKKDSDFLYYLARSPVFREYAIQHMEGTSGRQRVPNAAVANFSFLCPPPEERQEIAAIFSTLDDRIALLRETNATLEAIAQALFKSWFVDFDPVRAKQEGREPEGMDADTAALFPDSFEESELGLVPKGWKVGAVADIGEVICGKTPPTSETANYGDDVPFITIPDMHNLLVITSTNRSLSIIGANTQKKKTLPSGSICVSCIATAGLVAWVTTPSQTNQQINSVVPFLKWGNSFPLFTLRRIGDAVRAGGSGGSVFHNLNKSGFEQLKVLFPNEQLAITFGEITEPIIDKIIKNQKQAQTLTTLRDTLLPRLISGQLRLPDAETLNIYQEMELDAEATTEDFSVVQKECI